MAKNRLTINDYFKGYDQTKLPVEHIENAKVLIERVNKFFENYPDSITQNSGYRSKEKHLAIYKAKGITDESKIPMQSAHLFGNAIDVGDANNKIKEYVKANIPLAEQLSLFFEDFSVTVNWVHLGDKPPKSGKRFFMP
jgi:hypothetical protein